jgi:formate/nitrite transporter FocA (FNT family)
MGAALATIGSTGVADILGTGLSQVILGCLFPIGLILVIFTGAELFTGDAMFAPRAVFQGHATLRPDISMGCSVHR